jgi:hypothetical protein
VHHIRGSHYYLRHSDKPGILASALSRPRFETRQDQSSVKCSDPFRRFDWRWPHQCLPQKSCHTGEGRCPFRPWVPAFAGKTGTGIALNHRRVGRPSIISSSPAESRRQPNVPVVRDLGRIELGGENRFGLVRGARRLRRDRQIRNGAAEARRRRRLLSRLGPRTCPAVTRGDGSAVQAAPWVKPTGHPSGAVAPSLSTVSRHQPLPSLAREPAKSCGRSDRRFPWRRNHLRGFSRRDPSGSARVSTAQPAH